MFLNAHFLSVVQCRLLLHNTSNTTTRSMPQNDLLVDILGVLTVHIDRTDTRLLNRAAIPAMRIL